MGSQKEKILGICEESLISKGNFFWKMFFNGSGKWFGKVKTFKNSGKTN